MRSLIFMLLVSGLLCVPFAVADDPPEPEAMCDYDVLIYWGTLGNPPHTFWFYFSVIKQPCGYIAFTVRIEQLDEQGNTTQLDLIGTMGEDEPKSVPLHPDTEVVLVAFLARCDSCGKEIQRVTNFP